MSRADEIEARVRQALAPTELEVRNDSARHTGHAGDDGSGESHFFVRVRSMAFQGKSRIARHRAVHAALGPDLMAQIHALQLDLDV
jgi:BolA protein